MKLVVSLTVSLTLSLFTFATIYSLLLRYDPDKLNRREWNEYEFNIRVSPNSYCTPAFVEDQDATREPGCYARGLKAI